MLTKLNRAIVETVSGATVPNGFLEFFNQADGAPVNAYADANGQNSLGSEVQADEFGFVSVFLYPGVYRIVAKNQSRVTITTYEHEPIFNVQAASRSGLSLQRMNHTVGNFKLFQRQVSGGLSVELWGLNPLDLEGNFAPSPDNPIQISFQKQGYSATLHLGSEVAAVLPNNQSLGLGSNGTITLYVYAVYDAPNSEQSQGAWNLCITTNTQFDESYEYTTINFLGSGTYNPNGLNSLNGGPITGPVRLLGKLEVQRNSGQWRPNPNVSADRRTVGYTGAQTEITPRGRELLIQESATEMKNVLDFSSLGHSFSELPDVPDVRFVRLNSDQTVSSRSASQMRGDMGLGTMATRNTGTGGSEHRTNAQNEDKFVTVDTNQTITGAKSFRRGGGSLRSDFMSFGGTEEGHKYNLVLTDISELPGGWPDFSVSGVDGVHIVRFRRTGDAVSANVRGFAIGAADATPDFSVADSFGVALGNPTGGFMGRGSVNAEAVFVAGTELFEDASGVYTAGSGALSNAVSNMLSSNTNAEIRASIGVDGGGGGGDGYLQFGLGQTSGDVRNASGGNNDGELEFDTVGFYRSSSNSHTVFNQFGGGIVVPGHTSDTRNYLYVGSRSADDPGPARVYATTWRDDSVGLREPVEMWTSGNLQFSLSGTTLTIIDNS